MKLGIIFGLVLCFFNKKQNNTITDYNVRFSKDREFTGSMTATIEYKKGDEGPYGTIRKDDGYRQPTVYVGNCYPADRIKSVLRDKLQLYRGRNCIICIL